MTRNDILPNSKIVEIYKQSNTIKQLWEEEPNALRNLGLTDNEIKKLFAFRKNVKLNFYDRLTQIISKEGIRVIWIIDKEYPKLLKDFGRYNIEPPLGLFIQGSIDSIDKGVAIVGTRSCSRYGHTMARKIAKKIAEARYTVISGLARGVDTEAHCGALETPHGKTIAVLPWLDRKEFYPPENIRLARDIIESGGGLVSEFYNPPRQFSTYAGFVLRNRIISGLSHCVILIETGIEGGTVRQAEISVSQGRKVFALKPKQKNKEAFEGFKRFLEIGAVPIKDHKPVLEYLKNLPSKTEDKRIDSFYQHHLK